MIESTHNRAHNGRQTRFQRLWKALRSKPNIDALECLGPGVPVGHRPTDQQVRRTLLRMLPIVPAGLIMYVFVVLLIRLLTTL